MQIVMEKLGLLNHHQVKQNRTSRSNRQVAMGCRWIGWLLAVATGPGHLLTSGWLGLMALPFPASSAGRV